MAAILSVAMMLRHLGDDAADRIEHAVGAAAPRLDWSVIDTSVIGDAIASEAT